MISLAAESVAQAATGSLVAAVWQGMLLAAAAGLGLRLLPKTPAAVRFAIWFGVFLVVTALPVISLWPRAGAVGGRSAWFVVDERWCVAIAAVWGAASLARAGSLVAAGLRVRTLWKRATPVEWAGANARILPLSDAQGQNDNSRGGGSRRAQICTSDEVDRPTVIGFFAPKILIPAWLLEKLSPAELEQIVLHESGHLGRADDWMNLAQKIALVVFPLNPALAWVERRLCFERELAVDERVLEATGAPKAYAACLANLAGHRLRRRRFALVLGALGRESELGRRVGRILRRGELMKPLQAKLVLGGAMLGLLVAAAGFERCPQVVGFASSSEGGSGVVAHGVQWLPTHTNEAAMNEAPGVVGGRIFRAVNVTYKASGDSRISTKVHAIHEINVVASGSDMRSRPTARTSGDLHPSLHDEAVKDGASGFLGLAGSVPGASSDEAAVVQPASGAVQWVVVTAWQDGQATRMVFATARVSNKAPVVEQDTDGVASEQEGPAYEQAPSYAAVPVRGGWLVIQL